MKSSAAACSVALLIAIISGCTSQAADDRNKGDATATREQEAVESLIEGLDDDSESVRQEALSGLEESLKRKIYFDPAAPAADRNRALKDVRAMWKNLKDRDLLEAVQERAPLEYFYDLNTAELFEAQAGAGPIETASGPHENMPAGVRAVVLSCEDCARERYVAWVQAPIAELERYGIEYNADGIEVDEDAILFWAIRSTDSGQWTLLGSPAADAIMSDAKNCAERDTPLFCRPGR